MQIANHDFNRSMDDYIAKRRDIKESPRSAQDNINWLKKGQDKERVIDLSDADESKPRVSIFAFFRKKIPSEEEIEKKEHAKEIERQKKIASELAEEDEDIETEEKLGQSNVGSSSSNIKQKQSLKTQEEEETEDTEEEKTGRRSGFMSILFGSRKKQEEEVPEIDERDETIAELKETVKLLHRWIEKLPPERISEFKRSPDFEKYKEGLRKLGLIKEPEKPKE